MSRVERKSFQKKNLQNIFNRQQWRFNIQRLYASFFQVKYFILQPLVLVYFSFLVFVRGRQGTSNCIMLLAFMTLMGTISLALVILNRLYYYYLLLLCKVITFFFVQATRLLTQGQLTDEEYEQIWRKILEETDIDDDKKLSNNEFTHVINKCPDFLTTFKVRIQCIFSI